MKKIAIIGAGNMGGAICKGIKDIEGLEVRVSNPHLQKLEKLKEVCPNIKVYTDNREAAKEADVVILAVKPWIVAVVIEEIRDILWGNKPLVVSIAAGIDLNVLKTKLHLENTGMAYAIPNTAIAVGKGVTFICHDKCNEEQVELLNRIFGAMGIAAIVPPRLMDAGMALCSCGIAYVYKFMQAAAQAGTQLGFYPADALKYAVATMEGAIEIMKQTPDTTPQKEIDKVTTPGGYTIKGVNELEHTGFTSSVIASILKPTKD